MSQEKEQNQRKPTKQDVANFEEAFQIFAERIKRDAVKPRPMGAAQTDVMQYGNRSESTFKARDALLLSMSKVNIDPFLSTAIVGSVVVHTEATKTVATPKDIKFAVPTNDGSKDLQQIINNMHKGIFLKKEAPIKFNMSATESDHEPKSPISTASISTPTNRQV